MQDFFECMFGLMKTDGEMRGFLQFVYNMRLNVFFYSILIYLDVLISLDV